MANNFITNNKEQQKTLKTRINTLISVCDELKFLVGFFYFSGWEELYKSLKNNKDAKLKLLVGLQVDKLLSQIVEHSEQEKGLSEDEQFARFMTSMGFAINSEQMDNEEFYNQVSFFLEMIENQRLIIRKTANPNHAKLYLFKFNHKQASVQDSTGQFITGSSNLTRAGLESQDEFNVEIKDYGFNSAEEYFDSLWEIAIPITEIEDRKEFLIKFIQHRSQAATVTPFEAYMLILKTYLDLQQQKQISPSVENLLSESGYTKYSYQTDAANQALSIIEEYNGVIIADVVGLGKSVIAAMIAKNIGKRGMVICPPGLIGDSNAKTGWWGYLNDFKLHDWEVNSRGKLTEIAENINDRDIEIIVVDEAHYYRNQDTADYEALLSICRDRQVILLTATPFNNSPADIFSVLKLFIVPGKSGITIEDNLEALFNGYNYRFKQLSEIIKYAHSKNIKKRELAEKKYIKMFGGNLPIDLDLVRDETKKISNQIKSIISPIVIRRNRLDLKTDYLYSQEVTQLSEVKDPQELFYHLTEEQSEFYNRIISDYFDEDGVFTGAIYKPFVYEKIIKDDDKLDEKSNRALQQQQNLYDFMRRLLVKRFESSFGAFSKSIDRFLHVHKLVRQFIDNSGGKFILDRDLIEQIYLKDEDEILVYLEKFENDLLEKKIPKNNTVYDVNNFQLKDKFLDDIDNDIELFESIKNELLKLDMVNNDPKREKVYNELIEMLDSEVPKRKIIIFSEYVHTILHLEPFFREKFGNRLLVCDGKVSKQLAKFLTSDFNAQYKGTQTDDFDILITSDKLSEGFNLNRAGAIINYDIPWNPTRVIQRVGRINRIGAKVFDELFIFNFFPSEIGADVVKSREIARQKMFLIHNALGEDAKMFDEKEEPSAAKLYKKINTNPENEEEINTATHVRNLYKELSEKHPGVINKIANLPARVKSAKQYHKNQVNVLRRKGLSLFSQIVEPKSEAEKYEVQEIAFEELLNYVECEFDEPRLDLSEKFWSIYETIKKHRAKDTSPKSEASLEKKANNNLKIALKISNPAEFDDYEFMKVLITDIRKYHTLSARTLGRLGRKELKPNSGKKEVEAFFDEVRWIKKRFGADYLVRLLKRTENQKNEVIIAVENICLENLK